MMLGVCKGLYNTTTDVICRRENIENIVCLCPDWESFLQMCYLYNSYKKNSVLSCSDYQKSGVDEKSLKCSRCINKDEMCHNEKWEGRKIVDMQLDEAGTDEQWKKFAVLPRDNQENLFFLIVLLMIKRLKFKNHPLCLADVICVYDGMFLEKRFRKMVNKFVQDVHDSLGDLGERKVAEAVKDLERITEFFYNLNAIYAKREEIFIQANDYLDHLYLGVEKRGTDLSWKGVSRDNFSAKLKQGILDRDIESFLFSSGDPLFKDRFYTSITIMRTYVSKCQEIYHMFSQVAVDGLLNILAQLFHHVTAELTDIKGLENAAFTSERSFRADSELVLNYFKEADIMAKCQRGEDACWNTWELALA